MVFQGNFQSRSATVVASIWPEMTNQSNSDTFGVVKQVLAFVFHQILGRPGAGNGQRATIEVGE